jgi:hypothetical protein
MAKTQLDSKNTGFSLDLLKVHKDAASFKKWYDPIYKGAKAEDIYNGLVKKKETLDKLKAEKAKK